MEALFFSDESQRSAVGKKDESRERLWRLWPLESALAVRTNILDGAII